jgi:amidase
MANRSVPHPPLCHSPAGITRRTFLRSSAAAGAMAGVGSLACSPPPAQATVQVQTGDFPLEELGVAALGTAMAAGEWTSRQVVDAYLQRIDQMNESGPALRAIIEVNPEASAQADQLDRERRAGMIRGPLHGVPVVLKDNIDTADQMTTTAGSLALQGWLAPRDAGLVERLRAGGALILAKANLSEWANFRSTRSSSGWSGRGGQCRNPYVLDRNPCGSSSGSGVVVSANLSMLAVGTETDGSIVCPASANGVVGVKPTVGLVSRSGVIPISESQDTAGPMARTVADAAVLLGVLAGVDPRDPATEEAGDRGLADYTGFLDADGARGMRIGVARRFLGFHEEVDRVVESAIAVLRDLGAVVVDPVDLGATGGSGMSLGAAETEVLLFEFKTGLNAYLSARPLEAEVRSLTELIAFNQRHADEEMPYFGQERLLEAEARGSQSDPRYLTALATARRLARDEGIDRTMDEHRLDAILGATGGPAWTTDLVNGDHFGGSSSVYPAVAGYPNISVPAGAVHGLPVGVSFFGRAWSEPLLIRIAYGFEQATRARRVPELRPSLT